MKAAVLLVLLPALARADSHLSVYVPSGMLLIGLGDDPTLVTAAGNKGVVRCFAETDKVTAIAGAGEVAVTGCYVGIRRDGKLIAPPAGRLSFSHLMPPLDGTVSIKQTKDAVQLQLDGSAANAIALWVDCADKRGDLSCRTNNGMLGKFHWEIAIDVLKGGAVRRPAAFAP